MNAHAALFEVTSADMARHGAVWWRGNWECRNFHGYFQSREDGTGPWQFQIDSFDDTDCWVDTLDASGKMIHEAVPIDDQSRITVRGRKYCLDHWAH